MQLNLLLKLRPYILADLLQADKQNCVVRGSQRRRDEFDFAPRRLDSHANLSSSAITCARVFYSLSS
jgi:hypothetical protein